jgi:hypothetical protein
MKQKRVSMAGRGCQPRWQALGTGQWQARRLHGAHLPAPAVGVDADRWVQLLDLGRDGLKCVVVVALRVAALRVAVRPLPPRWLPPPDLRKSLPFEPRSSRGRRRLTIGRRGGAARGGVGAAAWLVLEPPARNGPAPHQLRRAAPPRPPHPTPVFSSEGPPRVAHHHETRSPCPRRYLLRVPSALSASVSQ